MNYLDRSTHLLLVTDNLHEATRIQAFPDQWSGPKHEIHQQYSLTGALKALDLQAFDLILMDPDLPDRQGTEAIRQVQLAAPQLPILLLLGGAYRGSMEDFRPLGVRSYLFFEDVTPASLSWACDAILEKHHADLLLQEAQEIAKMGSWEIDPGNNRWYPSPATREIFGQALDSLEQYLELVHPDDQREVALTLMSALREQKGFESEHRILIENSLEKRIFLKGKVELDHSHQIHRLWGTIYELGVSELQADPVHTLNGNGHGVPEKENGEVMELEPINMEKLTDINYLKQVAGGDESIMGKAIKKFIEATPEMIDKMQEALREKDYPLLAKVAHKLKSSVALMGMDDGLRTVKSIEMMAKEEERLAHLPFLVDRITQITELAIEELQQQLTTLQPS